MAALGAGAGAFEGDRAREQERMRRAQLSQQGAMFNANMRQRQSEADRQQANYDSSVALREKELADQQEKEQANLDRSFQAGQEDKAYNRERNDWQDSWKAALDAQEMQEREERIKANRADLAEYERVTRLEQEQLANRKNAAKLGIGALAYSSRMNGGRAPMSALELFEKQTGIKSTSAFWTDDGFVLKRLGPAVDQSGKPVQGQMAEYDERMPVAMALSLLRDEFGDKEAEAQYKAMQSSNSGAGQTPPGGPQEMTKAAEIAFRSRMDTFKDREKALYDGLREERNAARREQIEAALKRLGTDRDALIASATGATPPAAPDDIETDPVKRAMSGQAKTGQKGQGGGYGPVEEKTLANGERVKVRRRPDGKYEQVK